MSSEKLDFMYIGTARAASTWLYWNLREHPEICVSEKKEDPPFSSQGQLKKDYFKQNFKQAKKNQLKGAFPVDFMLNKENAKLCKKFFPKIKLLVVSRDPVERAYSHYLHDLSRGEFKSKTSFLEATEQKPIILEYGFYFRQLQPFFTLFKRENLLILNYEDLKKDELKFFKKILNFLEVSPDFIPKQLKATFNPTPKKRLHSMLLGQLLKKLNKLTQKLKSQTSWGAPLIKGLKKIGLSRLITFIQKKNLKDPKGTTLKRQSYKIPEEDKKTLQKIYQTDQEKLQRLLKL